MSNKPFGKAIKLERLRSHFEDWSYCIDTGYKSINKNGCRLLQICTEFDMYLLFTDFKHKLSS